MEKEKKLLVYVHGDILGDALLKLPAISVLKQGFPDHKIIWFSGCSKSIFQTALSPLINNYVDQIIDDKQLGKSWKEWLSPCPIKEHIDIIIDTQHIIRTTLLLKRVPHSLFVSPAASFYFSDKKPSNEIDYSGTMKERLLALFNIASSSKLSSNFKLSLPLEYDREAEKRLPSDSNYIGLAPGAGGKNKCWPIDRYASVAKKQIELDRKPVFFLGPEELDDYSYLKKEVPDALFPEQECDHGNGLKGPLLAIALAKRLSVGVANDSGIGHIMAIADIPLVSLFGPSNRSKFSSKTKDYKVIEAGAYGSNEMVSIPIEPVLKAVD